VEYLLRPNLDILKTGYKPTFVISNRKEVIHLTLGTNVIGNLPDELALSDHRYILIEVKILQVKKLHYVTPRELSGYPTRTFLKVNLEVVPRITCSV
jgi:hypothetical protein